MQKHIVPRVIEIFGVRNALDIYASTFMDALGSQNETRKVLSVGAGDCTLEVRLAKRLLSQIGPTFELLCYDLSEARLARGRANAVAEGLQEQVSFRVGDIRELPADEQFCGVMAHHMLHHVQELETAFSRLAAVLHPHGRFVTMDMIGRNGHQRWPEALDILRALWRTLPMEYRYNHQTRQCDEEFVDRNHAIRGFEGIRAQDILPLLLERFDFEAFLGYGNLTDPFVERAYGHNLAPDDARACALVDFVHLLNDRLLDSGNIKPTMMFAIVRAKGQSPAATRCFRHWTPEYCIRRPDRGP
jgi:SAM-dependent methyltransferase